MSSTTSTAGTVNTSSTGRTFISGTASGLNTNALIQAAVSKKTAEATAITDTITTNQNKISAYQSLQGQISSLENALDALKSSTNNKDATNSGSLDITKAFDTKGTTISTSDSSITASNVLTASADSTATNGTHTVIVKQLAQAEQVTGTVQNSKTTALGYSGSFSLNLDDKTAASINIAPGSTLQDIQTAINAQALITGVSADILQVSNGSFKLVLSGSDPNQQINVSGVSGDDVLTNLGITDGSGNFVNINQPAQPAKISLDGTDVTRDTNTFDGVLTGLQLSINSAAPNSAILLQVGNNTNGVSSAITHLINAYNTLSDTISSNQKVNNDGSVDSSETLFGDNILTSLGTQLNRIIAGTGNNSSNSYNSLGALGIVLDSSNHLVIKNQTALDNALNNNFSQVQSFFASSFSSDNSGLTLVQNNTNLNRTLSLQITTDVSGNTITGTSVDGSTDNFTINGNQLVGKVGTDYAGLVLNYTGGSGIINVTIQQGVADSLVSLLDSFNNTNNGLLATQITNTKNNDAHLQTQVTKINTDAQTLENQLITKYANMEAAISKAQLAQKSIEAISGFLNSSSGG